MASLGSQDLHVNITWDTEPSEKAKAFVKLAVLEALSEVELSDKTTVELTEKTKELIRAEVYRALADISLDNLNMLTKKVISQLAQEIRCQTGMREAH